MATRAEIEQWIAAHGGPENVAYGYEDVDADNPAFNNPNDPNYNGRTQTPDKVKTRRESWTDKTTGATYSAVRTPGAVDVFQDIKETPPTRTAASSASPASPASGATIQTEGTPDPSKPGGFDSERPIKVTRDKDGKQVGLGVPLEGKELQDWYADRERSRNPGRKTDAEVAAETKAANAGLGSTTISETIGGKAYNKVKTVTKGPNGGTVTEEHYEDPANPGVKIPTPLAPPTGAGTQLGSTTTKDAQGNTTKVTEYLQPDGTTRKVTDTAQVATNTDVRTDPQTGRRYELIRNPDGTVKGEREIPQTGGTPSYTYPEIKLAYGNIANEVMAISRDIYSRVGVGPGKLTKEEADRLFKPIYDQAQLRVSELNGIVSTQKSVWDSQVQTANQRLDAATRMAGQAIGMVKDVGMMAPGTGAVAGQAMWDMMHAQKAFAGGMGGLNDPALPGYLQGAMGMGPDTAAAPGGQPAAVPGSSVQAAAGGPNAIGLGASITSDAGAVPAPAVAGSGGLPGADPAMAAAEAARQQAMAASITSDAGGVPTAGEPGGPPLAPGPVWQPPGATPPVPLPSPAGAPVGSDPGFYRGPPGGGEAQDPGFRVGPPGGGEAQDPGFSRPALQGGPHGYLNPATGGGVTINIGGQPQNGGAAITGQPADYLQPTQQEQRPSLAAMQRGLAGSLLDTFSQDAVEAAWQQHAGGSLLGGGMG